MGTVVDDYLLQLILMDSLVYASARCIPDAERIIQSFLPPGLYDRIMARYDALSEDWGGDEVLLPPRCLGRARLKSPAWKRMMVERLLQIVCASGCAGCEGPAEVAALAHRIDAVPECRQVFAWWRSQKPGHSERPGFCGF